MKNVAESDPARVLFVDDEPAVIGAITRMLHAHRDEFEVRGATNAAEALVIANAWRPTAIVSDFAMPGMDGLELVAAVRSDPRLAVIPVIMLTGSADADLKRRALDAGAVDLLNKPAQTLDLVARLRSVVRLRKKEDHIRGENARLRDQVRLRTSELEHSHNELVLRLALVAEFRDRETGAHVCRVAHASAMIAEAMGLDEEFRGTVLPAAALHDIGKIGVPDAILLKPGALSEDERRIMQTHCRIGWEMLQMRPAHDLAIGSLIPDAVRASDGSPGNRFLDCAAQVALHHHERWDGAGYPTGRSGEDIPLAARIVAVADVFEALRHARPYKTAMPSDQAMRIMREGAGAHFDPEVAGAFETVSGRIDDMFARFADAAEGRTPQVAA